MFPLFFLFPGRRWSRRRVSWWSRKRLNRLATKPVGYTTALLHLQALIRIVEDLHSSCTQAGLPATDRASIVWGTQERCELKQNLLNKSLRISNAFLGPHELQKFGRSGGNDSKQRLKMIQLGAGNSHSEDSITGFKMPS